MVSVASVELDRLNRDIAAKNAEIDRIKATWGDLTFDMQVAAGGQILDCQREIDRLSGRLAKLSGNVNDSMRGTLAKELKECVLEAILTSEVMEKVRQLWSVQDPSNRTTFIRLGLDYGGFGVPTVTITGDSTRTGSGPKTPRSYWMVNGEKASTKDIILAFGASYNQVKAFVDMTPDERVALRDAIVTGEGLAKFEE